MTGGNEDRISTVKIADGAIGADYIRRVYVDEHDELVVELDEGGAVIYPSGHPLRELHRERQQQA